MPISLATWDVVYLCCDCLGGGHINHIGICIGSGSSCLHIMQVYGRPFSIDPPVKMKYRLFRSIKTNSPNTRFVLFIGLVNNPFIYPRFCNYMLDRYAIGNFRVAVLITPMKWVTCIHNYSSAGNDAKYESAQTILSMLSHGSTSYFSTVVT